MNGETERGYSPALIVYLGLLSGLMGGLVLFALDTFTWGAAVGEVFFTDVRLKFTFLLLPFFFYSVVGMALGLFFSLFCLFLARGGRSSVLTALPNSFPLFLLWTSTLLVFGMVGWERNNLQIGRPNGPVYLAAIVGFSFLPVYFTLLFGGFAWRNTAARAVGLLIVALPFLFSVRLMIRSDEYPLPSSLEKRIHSKEDGRETRNLLLFTIDTLRRDHLGCYGAADVKTPVIDRLAREGVLFTQCVAQAPITLPSHSSILTGTYPTFHGVRDNGFYRLNDTSRTIAEVLKERGYYTAAFISAFPLDSSFGLDQGFDLYDDRLLDKDAFYFSRVADHYTFSKMMKMAGLFRPVVIAERKAEKTTERVLQLLDLLGDRPFFLWVHLFDPHNPLNPPARYEAMYAGSELLERVGAQERSTIRRTRDFTGYDPRSPEASYMKALYKAEVTYADDHVGKVIDRLDDLGLSEKTLVVLTADHGQSLYEHDYVGHSGALYAQTLDVPLILRCPALLPARVRVDGLVQSVDVAPTILDLLGVSEAEKTQGASLVELIESEKGGGGERVAYFETLHSPKAAERFRGIIVGDWKLIRSEDGSFHGLYNIASDPGEMNDLSRKEAEFLERMEDILEDLVNRTASGEVDTRISVDDEAREILKSLGYVW